MPALIAAEVPILSVEAALAALASFTLVGPLGLPWWLPLVFLAVAGAVIAALGRLAGSRRRECWKGLAVLRSLHGRNRVVALVLVAVFAQILRNWLMLHAVGVDASRLRRDGRLDRDRDAEPAARRAERRRSRRRTDPRRQRRRATAAAGVLLTVTGTVGALCFAGWAAVDRLRPGQPTPAIPSTSLNYPGSATPTSVSPGLWAPSTAIRATRDVGQEPGPVVNAVDEFVAGVAPAQA